jgi:uncharacterized protein YbjT (DUF2867 family)
VRHATLQDLVQQDFLNFSGAETALAGYDACFFCLGVSSAGLTEPVYRRVTYDIAMAVASTLVRLDPGMTFIFVSGTGADSSARGRVMWARIKGETENALLALPFKAVYVFRPGYIQPLHGITSRTKLYRALYAILAPLYPLVKALFPAAVTTTDQIGRAMIELAEHGGPKRLLENADINAVSR